MKAIYVRALRYDPLVDEQPVFEEYNIPTDNPLSVMAIMARIHETDPSFACRTSQCFHGTCLSCLVRVNGKDVLGCETMVHPGERITLEPCSKYRVLRDVVVDFSETREEEA